MPSVLTYNNHGLKFLVGQSYVRLGSMKSPYLILEFSSSSFVPTDNLLYNEYRTKSSWSQVSSSPNRWKLEFSAWGLPQEQIGYGLGALFSTTNIGNAGTLIPSNLDNGTCKLIESGALDAVIDGVRCVSFDRMFSGCTGLTEINPIHLSTVQNLGGMFQGCVNVESGAYDQYYWFYLNAGSITNHSGTFTDCGSNTTTGASELAQIPVGWGGTLVPASTLMTSTRQAYTSSNYTSWKITGNAPDWSATNGMYLFTESSVSSYAGVSMNRSRIPNGLNGLATASGNALYFYPAFVQSSKIPGSSGNTVTWLITTDSPNGNLTAGQGNTDMPGTLDYSSYGPFTREYGTYMASNDVYFTFLVTNVPIDSWTGLNDAMGFLYNSNFKADGGFRYFF